MKRILFVCMGNTCRSTMAEAIAGKVIHEMGRDSDFEIGSAGIYAIPGDSASDGAVKAMDALGIDLSCHSAKRLDSYSAANSDIILVMTEEQKKSVILMFLGVKDKLFTIREFAAGAAGDINDPFGQDINMYKKCAHELTELITCAIKKLCE